MSLFTNVSMTGTGLIAMAIMFLLHLAGFSASADSVSGIAVALGDFISAVLAFVGQLRREDLNAGMFRR